MVPGTVLAGQTVHGQLFVVVVGLNAGIASARAGVTPLPGLSPLAFLVMPVAEIPLRGSHNVENVLAAVCVARLAGVPAETIRASVASFKAVEHRLEFVRVLQGVEYFNDSKATNIDAAMKAIGAFPAGIHLILGGKDKNSDYTTLWPLLRERVKAVYTIGSAAEKIERELHGVVKMVGAGTIDVAVREAHKAAVPGDVVLLAPACSSFDMFADYADRGRQFKQEVLKLVSEK